jgi:RNA polymerase sigma factor (sigma-70 family)
MNTAMSLSSARSEDNERIVAAVVDQGPRLRDFVRRQVADLSEVEDIVQDTFVEMICTYRLMEPIEHLAAWLRRVARNRIIDRFRRRSRAVASSEPSSFHDEGSDAEPVPLFDEWFAPVGAEPEASYVREVLAEELVAALDALPPDQRAVFVAHELDGRSFKELAIETGVGINTLLGRKHAAVRQLRRRLHDIRAEFDT